MADRKDPSKMTVKLRSRSGEEMETAADCEEVYTEFYMPSADSAIESVFGFDIGIPIGQTDGVFISHPEGDRDVRMTDDLHRIIFVATPPWDGDDPLRAYSRDGEELQVKLVDDAPRSQQDFDSILEDLDSLD